MTLRKPVVYSDMTCQEATVAYLDALEYSNVIEYCRTVGWRSILRCFLTAHIILSHASM
jgi:hypothetical protein